MMWARGISEFGAIVMLTYSPKVTSVLIYDRFTTGGLNEALPVAVVAVAFGLPEEEALKAVTINAAEFMGIGDQVGSLEPGKQATFLITTGTPLDMTSDIEQSYIQGREIDMNDIQKHFFDKYMEKVRQNRRVVS